MEVLILVACAEKKKVPSTAGMQETVKTCPTIQQRIQVVPERMKAMEEAIQKKDFAAFANLTMLDSDHFHELCHTTVPPIHYMNEVSFNVVKLVNEFNEKEVRAAYTFDAGPNAVIYLPRRFVAEFLAAVLHFFPPSSLEG
jgi:diphosphomevalonate decarboxylase